MQGDWQPCSLGDDESDLTAGSNDENASFLGVLLQASSASAEQVQSSDGDDTKFALQLMLE